MIGVEHEWPSRTVTGIGIGIAAMAGLLLTLLVNSGCQGAPAEAEPRPSALAAPAPPAPPARTAAEELAARSGIEVVALRSTAGGSLLDFRFRVLDPDKAAPLLRHESPTYVVEPESGLVLAVPAPAFVGPLRQVDARPRPGTVYFAMFANPDKRVRAGMPVRVVVGETTLEDVIVQ